MLTPSLDRIHRSEFPPDFIFGAGTSAIQIEGNGTEGGRGPSTGDYMIHADEGGKGVDSYNMYKEDVKLLKDMGIPYYRFSIAWPRIVPDGSLEKINQQGIDYYNRLLDELVKNGTKFNHKNLLVLFFDQVDLSLHSIRPFVTLFHFDMPEGLQKRYGGFMDRQIIKDFSDYCELCFKTFGNRVKHWITINEASTLILFTDACLTPKQREDPLNQFIANHHVLLSHAAAAKIYRQKYKGTQGGEVGMAIVSKWFEPRSPTSPDDREAAETTFDFAMGWFLDPLKYGDYPRRMKKWVHGLPQFTESEKSDLKDSCDFLGINYYTGSYMEGVRSGQLLVKEGITDLRYRIIEKDDRDGVPIGPVANGVYRINIYPEGLRKLLLHVKDYYGNQKTYITENGCSSYPNITLSIPEAQATGQTSEIEKELNDVQRLECFQMHLHAAHQAMEEGANLKGYIFWSLLDNDEFGNYDVRFGLSYVDYHDNFKRHLKSSGKWYSTFLAPE